MQINFGDQLGNLTTGKKLSQMSNCRTEMQRVKWGFFCKGTITQIYSPKISFHRFKSTANLLLAQKRVINICFCKF